MGEFVCKYINCKKFILLRKQKIDIRFMNRMYEEMQIVRKAEQKNAALYSI